MRVSQQNQQLTVKKAIILPLSSPEPTDILQASALQSGATVVTDKEFSSIEKRSMISGAFFGAVLNSAPKPTMSRASVKADCPPKSLNRAQRRFLAVMSSKKGGVGKTLSALLVADLATLNGIPVTVIQVDDQARLEKTIKQQVITIRVPYKEARRNPALLSKAFDKLHAAIESMAAGGPSVLIDVGPSEADAFIEWAMLVGLDEDLIEYGIQGLAIVPAVAEPESIRQAGRTLSLFSRALPSFKRAFMENQRDGEFSDLAPGSEAARVFDQELSPHFNTATRLTMPGIDAGSWQPFEQACIRFIDVVGMDVADVMRVTGLSRPQSKLVRGDVAHFFAGMECELGRVLPVGEAE